MLFRSRKSIQASTEEGSNQCEYRKIVESGRVYEKGIIHASTEKIFGRVPEKSRVSVSTDKWKNPSEYREKVESVRVPEYCPDEYRKTLESV